MQCIVSKYSSGLKLAMNSCCVTYDVPFISGVHLDLYTHREPQPKCTFLHEVEHNETTLMHLDNTIIFRGHQS